MNIVGAIATFFGPVGQLASMGLGFVSSLLGLFGKKQEPRPLGEIVREQIHDALAKYGDETLNDKASGLISAFGNSKSYLDGAAQSGKLLSKEEMIIASSRVPINQGVEFMGTLANNIYNKFLRFSEDPDPKKCIRYCELYAQLAGLRDVILTQMIALTGDEMKNDVNGLMTMQRDFRDGTKILLEPLFDANVEQVILPYFDPDINKITDSYARSVLGLGTEYDRSKAGMYCLMAEGKDKKLKDLVWSTNEKMFLVKNKPYITLAQHDDSNCYWKLVPHGNNLYSIVNKKGCATGEDVCGSLLSFGLDRDFFANIDSSDGIMWEIKWENPQSNR